MHTIISEAKKACRTDNENESTNITGKYIKNEKDAGLRDLIQQINRTSNFSVRWTIWTLICNEYPLIHPRESLFCIWEHAECPGFSRKARGMVDTSAVSIIRCLHYRNTCLHWNISNICFELHREIREVFCIIRATKAGKEEYFVYLSARG